MAYGRQWRIGESGESAASIGGAGVTAWLRGWRRGGAGIAAWLQRRWRAASMAKRRKRGGGEKRRNAALKIIIKSNSMA